jgi:hypothetical protein
MVGLLINKFVFVLLDENIGGFCEDGCLRKGKSNGSECDEGNE